MKRILLSIVLMTSSIFIGFKTFAQEKILNYETQIEIQRDGRINILETILYDFGDIEKHGIYRNIPITKKNIEGKEYQIEISNISVTNEKNIPYKFTTSTHGKTLEIKIGDSNKTLTGTHTYKIEYLISGAITYFDTFDELYWNSIGTDWKIGIEEGKTIIVPKDIPLHEIEKVCYTGILGSTEQKCVINTTENSIEIKTQNLDAYNGLTFALKIPKGYLEILEPKPYGEKNPFILLLLALWALAWYLILPIMVGLNWIKERIFVKNNKRVVAAWFEPPKLDNKTIFTPAETVYLITKKANPKLLVATIISLAQRGYLKIKQQEKTTLGFKKTIFTLDKTENNKNIKDIDLLAPHEKLLYEKMFSKSEIIKLEELSKTNFVTTFNSFNELIDDRLHEQGLIQRNAGKEKNSYLLKASLLGFFGVISANIFLLIATYLWSRNRGYTKKGIEKLSEALSLKNFLVSQKEQLDFQAKNQMFFEKLLPYATAFGAERIWIGKFKDLQFKQSDWYEGNLTPNQGIYLLSREINKNITQAYSSANRSSSGFSSGFSGGSSGGGGGGGGGGSW